MASASGGNPLLLLTMIIWISVVLSAVLDNIPYAAAMVHVIEDLARAAGLPVTTLAWTLAMGTNLGGNATPVGASANVVGLALAEKHAVHISWGEYCRRAFPGVVATVAMANIFIVFRYLM
jgi:Na+/H+ antiporter NhaD/arsenite permease-like protein